MGSIIMWLPSIISAVIEIIKLIRELKKKGVNVDSCMVAVKDARTKGDLTKLEQMLDKLRKGSTDC